ncbi:MAG: HAD family phosphatase [Anaerolineaceae bacterium]|jgi:putative hydrolase of the HAD superfamily
MHKIKAVIWDMGGVLLREEDAEPRLKLAEKHNIDLEKLYQLVFNSRSAKLAGVGAISEEEHWLTVAHEVGLAKDRLSAFRNTFWSGDRVDATLIEFIQSLRPAYKTALLSNAWTGMRKALEEYYNCLWAFDAVIISAEVRLAKPDPAIYKLMLDQLQIAPQEAIFVDDLIENIQAACDLGIHGIHFRNTDQAVTEVRALLA